MIPLTSDVNATAAAAAAAVDIFEAREMPPKKNKKNGLTGGFSLWIFNGRPVHSFIQFINFFFVLKLCFFFFDAEEELDETLFSTLRYRPEELESLEQSTKFTRKEIQLIYRGFKQVHLELIQ